MDKNCKSITYFRINHLKNFKLIFSAHGLPEKNIKNGDPYQWQVEQSVNKIIKSLNINTSTSTVEWKGVMVGIYSHNGFVSIKEGNISSS